MAESLASPTLPMARARVRIPNWASLGVLFGLLSTAAIALYGPIGVSGTYPRFVGAVTRAVSPEAAAGNSYLVKMGGFATPETMLAVGLLIGGFIAAMFARGRAPRAEFVHASETSTGRRYRDAFIGGTLIIFGARLAGGCTSGHIISGITQLAMSGLLFAAAVFGSGMLTARLMKAGGR